MVNICNHRITIYEEFWYILYQNQAQMIQFILLKYSGTILKSYNQSFSILVKTEITIFIIWFFTEMQKTKKKVIGFCIQSLSINTVAYVKATAAFASRSLRV